MQRIEVSRTEPSERNLVPKNIKKTSISFVWLSSKNYSNQNTVSLPNVVPAAVFRRWSKVDYVLDQITTRPSLNFHFRHFPINFLYIWKFCTNFTSLRIAPTLSACIKGCSGAFFLYSGDHALLSSPVRRHSRSCLWLAFLCAFSSILRNKSRRYPFQAYPMTFLDPTNLTSQDSAPSMALSLLHLSTSPSILPLMMLTAHGIQDCRLEMARYHLANGREAIEWKEEKAENWYLETEE